jgi:hypothetical protein
MRRVSDKQKKELARRSALKRSLLPLATNSSGQSVCWTCFELPDFRGLQLSHKKKSLAQGGKSDADTCIIECGRCHFGPDGHRTEGMG